MGVEFSENGKTLVVFISGEIDHHSASDLRTQIDDAIKNKNVENLVIDLSRIAFMDTSGIGLIMGRFKISKSLGISMKVVNVPKNLERIIKLSGIQNLGIL